MRRVWCGGLGGPCLRWAPPPLPVCPAGCDYTSIQAAISAAPSGALTGVEAGTYDGPLTIGKSLTLAGAGASLTTITVPRSGGTVITVETGASATVRAVSIAGGGADRPGQHARQQHHPRHRRPLQLRRGHAGPGWLPARRQHRHLRGGRFIINPGGTMALNGTTVTANRALRAGAGGIGTNGTMSLSGSTVTGNTADGAGGGLYNNPHGVLTVSDSTVSGNTAASYGGGLFNRGAATLTGSTVTGNTAGTDGGGIYVYSGTVTLQDTTVTGNVPDNCAPPGSVTGCTG